MEIEKKFELVLNSKTVLNPKSFETSVFDSLLKPKIAKNGPLLDLCKIKTSLLTLVLGPPAGDLLLPLLLRQFVLVRHTRRQQAIVGQEARLMNVWIIVCIFRLYCVRGK